MKNSVFSYFSLIIAFGILAGFPNMASAQTQNTSPTIRNYGPSTSDYNVNNGYSSRLNGQVDAYERGRYREQLEARRRSEYFKRFIDHDLSHRSRDTGGY